MLPTMAMEMLMRARVAQFEADKIRKSVSFELSHTRIHASPLKICLPLINLLWFWHCFEWHFFSHETVYNGAS